MIVTERVWSLLEQYEGPRVSATLTIDKQRSKYTKLSCDRPPPYRTGLQLVKKEANRSEALIFEDEERLFLRSEWRRNKQTGFTRSSSQVGWIFARGKRVPRVSRRLVRSGFLLCVVADRVAKSMLQRSCRALLTELLKLSESWWGNQAQEGRQIDGFRKIKGAQYALSFLDSHRFRIPPFKITEILKMPLKVKDDYDRS